MLWNALVIISDLRTGAILHWIEDLILGRLIIIGPVLVLICMLEFICILRSVYRLIFIYQLMHICRLFLFIQLSLVVLYWPRIRSGTINYESPADYTSLAKQKVAVEVIIGFAACENIPRGVADRSGGLGSVVLITSVFKVECPLIFEHKPFQPIWFILYPSSWDRHHILLKKTLAIFQIMQHYVQLHWSKHHKEYKTYLFYSKSNYLFSLRLLQSNFWSLNA